jgi:5-methylcytosine-specific restriction protein A
MPDLAPQGCHKPGCKAYRTHGAYCNEHKRKRQYVSRHAAGYNNEWLRIREKALERDHHLCRLCRHEGIFTQADEVDHIIPKSKGGTDDLTNLQSLCKQHHALKSQLESYFPKNRIRPAACPVTIVCGPPGAGKTTWCMERATAYDVVIDLDYIAEQMTGQRRRVSHDLKQCYLQNFLSVRNAMLDSLADRETGRAFFIVCAPSGTERREWCRLLGTNDVVVLTPDPYDCILNIERDINRDPKAVARESQAVLKWFTDYTE